MTQAPVVAGRKRPHSDEVNDDMRFAKRFNLLNLQTNGHAHSNSNYYIPVSSALSPVTQNMQQSSKPQMQVPNDEEFMQVDDTRDRVYIHNLDEELADIESDEERLIFLPDIEKRLSRIPHQVLTGAGSGENQQLVLYSVPKSLTVDEGSDSVRKAIIEARQRAREKAEEEARHEEMNRQYDQTGHVAATETAHGYSGGYDEEVVDDPDAMEIC
ncbi:hypothetical protein EJ03DRAFT_348862 [Teratosphaeria nubilosa]|uniref:Uncharacterized protein n=1 Tax=Teratosphaeria nubilosa TaxID=161662 RepID=A0A6G1LI02_9PEZI|nr:hypothetical protein EJ03DRAFT_348862 [Teratosphaeria nubilosa]